MGGGWCGHLPEASIARHAIEACGRFRGAAHHGTARRRRTTPHETSSTSLFALGSLDRTPATDFENVFGLFLKASMVGFTFSLVSRSYYYLRRRSPAPPFPPDHRQRQGNGGL